MRALIHLFLATTALFGEITTYTTEQKKALNHYLKLWEEPGFRIDQHGDFVHKTIDRVILAVNENPDYHDYWEHIAKAWSRFIGVKPTLIYIGEGEEFFSREVGEVIRIPPVEGVPTAFQAQCVRLLAPVLFPDEICVIADIDQFAFNTEFFHRPFDVLGEDSFIIYELLPIVKKRAQRIEFRMSYNAAKGEIFSEIFGVKNVEEIRQTLALWYHQEHEKYGFHTDQTLLFRYVSRWDKFDTHCYHLGRNYLDNALNRRLLKKSYLHGNAPLNWKFTPHMIRDCWKGRYVEIYLLKGPQPFNQAIYKTFGLDS